MNDERVPLTIAVGRGMVEHMLQFAEGILNVLEHEGAEAFLLENPEKVEELDRLLKRADYAINRVRQLALWRKEQDPEREEEAA